LFLLVLSEIVVLTDVGLADVVILQMRTAVELE
jgi:hypothetical protein